MKLTPLVVAIATVFSVSKTTAAPTCGDGGQLCFEHVQEGGLSYIKAWNQYIEIWVSSDKDARSVSNITKILVAPDGKSSKKLVLDDKVRGVYFNQRVEEGAPDNPRADSVTARFNSDRTLIDIYAVDHQPGKFRTVNHYTLHADEKLLGFYKTWQKKSTDALVTIGEVSLNFFATDHSSTYNRENLDIGPYKTFDPALAPVSATGHIFNTGKDFNDSVAYTQPNPYPKYIQAWKNKGNNRTDPPNKETLDYRDQTADPYFAFETKYNISGTSEFHTGHGYWNSKLPSDWYWIIPKTSKETMTGGPFKQFFRGAQLYVLSGHYVSGQEWPIRKGSNKSISGNKWVADVEEEKSKLIGPFYIGFSGEAKDADEARDKFIYLRDRADHIADNKMPKFFEEINYDIRGSDAPPLFVPNDKRGTVSVNLDSKSDKDIFEDRRPDSAIYILSDEGRPSSVSTGYQYWGYPGEDGSIKFTNVRPGTYRFSAYIRGLYGSHIEDGVVVKAGENTPVKGKFSHRYFGSADYEGRTVFSIGTPDFSPSEFRFGHFNHLSALKGKPARQFPFYGEDYWKYLNDTKKYTFDTAKTKAGDVPSTFWGKDAPQYVPVPNGKTPQPWRFEFNITTIDKSKPSAVFTLNLASHFNGSVLLDLNGGKYNKRWVPTDQGCNAMIRSGMGGCPAVGIFVIPMSQLQPGKNTLAVSSSGQFQLDSMKLEVTRADIGNLYKNQPNAWRDVDLFLQNGITNTSDQFGFGK